MKLNWLQALTPSIVTLWFFTFDGKDAVTTQVSAACALILFLIKCAE